MIIRAQLREMAASEIADAVPDEILARIRQSDPHPLFKAFVVGHEGESRGNLIGIGNVVKRWFSDAVRALFGKIHAGLQLFQGHAIGTNEHEGRQVIGEVVGKRLMDINGRESVVVVCHIDKDYRYLPLDVASVEADVELAADGSGARVVSVGEVTGVALGSSATERPGFAGATLLGQLQAFAGDIGRDNAGIVVSPTADLNAIMHEASAKTLLGERNSLTLRDDIVLERMASGRVLVNGRTFEELSHADAGRVRQAIDDRAGEEKAAARAKYLDPKTNPFIKV